MRLIFAFIGISVLLVLFVRMLTTADWQTRIYYRILRCWGAFWPFHRGKGLPKRLRNALKPLVPVWVPVEPGVTMLLEGNDLISRIILETGSWEASTWGAMKQHLCGGATFVDVGAHMGYFSLKAAAAVGAHGRVIAIEPHPVTARTLQNNIRESGATVIAIDNVACADSKTTLDLFTAEASNSGRSSFSRQNASLGGAVGASHSVSVDSLDSVIKRAQVSRVDVIKIDVEGAELQVLRGAQETLARYHPVLFVELDDRLLHSMGTSTTEIIEFLRDLGYICRRSLDEANFEFVPLKDASRPICELTCK